MGKSVELANKILEEVSKMRTSQRGFFQSAKGSEERRKNLSFSKRYESNVDKMIKEWNKLSEPNLFS